MNVTDYSKNRVDFAPYAVPPFPNLKRFWTTITVLALCVLYYIAGVTLYSANLKIMQAVTESAT